MVIFMLVLYNCARPVWARTPGKPSNFPGKGDWPLPHQGRVLPDRFLVCWLLSRELPALTCSLKGGSTSDGTGAVGGAGSGSAGAAFKVALMTWSNSVRPCPVVDEHWKTSGD